MGYSEAMEAAGAVVHQFEHFGSYQGDWWALVTLPDGRKGWINGSYGSCSGCDAFEAEFDYGTRDYCSEPHWVHDPACAECVRLKADYDKKLAEFGAGYLDGVMTDAEALKHASEHLEWDSDAQQMVDFIAKHSEAPHAD